MSPSHPILSWATLATSTFAVLHLMTRVDQVLARVSVCSLRNSKDHVRLEQHLRCAVIPIRLEAAHLSLRAWIFIASNMRVMVSFSQDGCKDP